MASADPLGTNPQGICQIFSVFPLANGLRQLTNFPDDGRPKAGCAGAGPSIACRVNGIATDIITGAIVFSTSCDPLGRNPNGEQFFVMAPDGTRLRQVSSFRGVETLPDGVHVEMAGPATYPFVIR